MGVPIPFSYAFLALLGVLPAVWLLGRALAHVVSRDRAARSVLAFGIAFAAWLVGVHVASLSLHSLRRGLPVGTIVVGALGLAAEHLRRKRAHLDQPEGLPVSRWALISALLATASITALALRNHIHDEVGLNGHMAFAAEMQNGVYPPRYLAFPDTLLRYHYGFDIVTASLTAMLHVRIDQAIDVGTLGLFFLSWCLLFTLGERLIGRRAAWLVPLLALFAGSIPAICDRPPATFVARIVEVCWVGKHYLNPPVVSYFFQHPWSIGVPVGATTLLVFTSKRPFNRWARLAVLVLCLAALSLSQITLFAGFLPAFFVAEIRGEKELSPMDGLKMLGVALLSLGAAKLMGGFFVVQKGLPRLDFKVHMGFGDTLSETLRWNLQTFGLLLPLALIGFFRLKRDALVLGLVAAGSVLVCNAIRYTNSEDIMKFATAASIFLAVLSASALASLWPGASADARPAWWRAVPVMASVLVTMLSGVVFVFFVSGDWPTLFPFLRSQPQEPSERDTAAIVWLRERLRPGDLMYRNSAHCDSYAQWGGLPQGQIGWATKAFGFPEKRINERDRLLRQLTPQPPERYRKEGFRYLVLDDTETDEALRTAAEIWIAEGKATRANDIEGLLIVELPR
ncbi:MAG: hypothetical protein U0441_24010 [Polyangiaceae bacterium]